MKESPILFSTEMVQAIINGSKTQTRRTRGLEKINEDPDKYYFQSLVLHATGAYTFVKKGNYNPKPEDVIVVKCRYGKPGDLLWVKETFAPKVTSDIQTNPVTIYKANYPGTEKEVTEYMKKFGHKWKPSIHMPKAAARIWLQIEEIRVQRLQDITYQDILQEGMPKPLGDYSSPVDWFETLWTKINGSGSWDANPWLWVITFKVISTTGKPTASQQHGITATQ